MILNILHLAPMIETDSTIIIWTKLRIMVVLAHTCMQSFLNGQASGTYLIIENHPELGRFGTSILNTNDFSKARLQERVSLVTKVPQLTIAQTPIFL